MEFKIVWNKFKILSRFVSYPVALNLTCILEVRVDQPKQSLLTGPCCVSWALLNAMYFEGYQICILRVTIVGYRATLLSCGQPWWSLASTPWAMSNIFLAFKLILMMTSGQNISQYTTAKLSVHVWNHDLIWWQYKIDTQTPFHKTTITISWTLSKTKIPITIIKAQMQSSPNQKSRTRDNETLQRQGIEERKLVGLTYDGASNMMGHRNGVTALMVTDSPLVKVSS